MPDKVQRAIEQADELVMTLCEPSRMTPAEAIAFLEGLLDNLQGALDALHEENDG
jgi:hypothetical protein